MKEYPFGLHDNPFRLTPDTEYFFPSEEHKIALKILEYAFSSDEPFTVIVGDVGVGKTMVLRKALKEIPENKEIALILTSNLSPDEILEAIVTDLGLNKEDCKSKEDFLKKIQEYVTSLAEKGKSLIVIIDEAQNLSLETLEQLRLLSNIELEKKKLLQIVLLGQNELGKKIKRLKQLKQRITISEYLGFLKKSEVPEYINFRLSKAGKGDVIITRYAMRYVARLSHGIPRLINSIMGRALLLAYSNGKNIISYNVVRQAAKTLSIKNTPKWWYFLLAAVILIFIVLFLFDEIDEKIVGIVSELIKRK